MLKKQMNGPAIDVKIIKRKSIKQSGFRTRYISSVGLHRIDGLWQQQEEEANTVTDPLGAAKTRLS